MDRYQVVKKIGEGSFGKALLVRSRESGKNMVVKEINMARMTSKERNEAKKETAVLAQLHHPNIVAYRESFEENRNLYIVMDYCDGGDLYGRINSQRGILFQEEQILDWFVQITLALKHIHDRKILHRDIKSQNIFLTKHGIVKLGDFGIAKVLNSTVELARTCIGTPYYLSPEICENKPYNNKSDVWSLGCVLYELTTLKHAFEAGNMKNLVLKIIRGSYPPVSPKYSYDLRSLIAQLFKRSPRDRPSISNVLRKSLLQNRIRKFLTDSEMAEEFSHTVMHGKKLQKALPSGANRPTPVLAKRPPSAAATPRYNPAAVYGQPVRISKENRRSADAKRPSSADVKRPVSAGPNRDELQRRKQELIERERKRREMAQRKEVQRSAASRHQELIEKQRASRLNKAREEGWKNLVDSLGSDESEKKSKNNEVKKVDNRPPSPKPVANAGNAKEAAKDRGNYDQYHAWLSDLEKKRNVAKPLIAGQTPAVVAGKVAGAKGAEAAEKAKVVHEYLERKKQAAANRARGHAEVWGGAGAAVTPKPAPRAKVTPKPQFHPPQQEDEYLARLRQIRLQNFNERRVQKEKMAARVEPQLKPGQQAFDNEVRRKKVEALRQQAEERAEKLKQQLERQQRNQHKEEHNKQLKGDAEAGRNGNYKSPRPAPQVKPTPAPRPSVPVKPAISMTAAMKAIGAAANEPQKQPAQPHIGMTAAMQAIGGAEPTPEKIPEKPPSPVEPSGRSPLQKKKDEILKKLNSKLPAKPSVPERPQWGQPVKPAVVPERPKWEEKTVGKSLAELSLEETASHMEATCVEDKVVKHEEDEEPASSRKQWAGQANTVLNILQGVELGDTLQTLDSQASTDSTDKGDTPAKQIMEGNVPSKTPAKTITISKTPSPAEADKIKAEESPKAPIIAQSQTEESQKALVNKEELTKAPVIREESPKAPVSTQKEESMKAPVKTEESPESPVDTEELPTGVVNAEASPKAPVRAWTEDSPKASVNIQTEESTNASSKTEATEPPKSAAIVKAEVLPKAPVDTELLPNDSGSKETSAKAVSGPTTPEPKSSQDSVEDQKTPLFDRVALEETEARVDGEDDMTLEDLDEADDIGIKDKDKAATLLAGLTTGHFDVDVKMLRTCSEPDLAKLFRTDIVENPFFETKDYANASINVEMDVTDEENGDDSESEQAVLEAMALVEETLETPSGDEKDEEVETGVETKSEEVVQEKEKTVTTIKVDFVVGEAEEEDDDDEEDEDLETMRESMMSLLQSQEAEDETVVPKKKTVKKKKMRVKRKKPKVRESKSETTTEKLDTSSVFERQMSDMSNGSEEDLRTMKETMKSLLRGSLEVREKPKTAPKPGAVRQVIPEAGPAGDAATVTGGPRVVDSIDTVDNTLLEGKETWQSDSDEDDQYFEEDDNMFCRLEESRAKLEEELGEETFLKAYKTVQAIHEDEDDTMEEGMAVIGDLLGEKNSHLYTSILGLVMADGAFMEDNE